jgi:hypothetical protein
MRRLTAFVLSTIIAMLVSPLTLYLTRCALFNHLLTADEIARQIDKEPLGFLFTLVVFCVVVARWFYKSAIKEHWAIPVFRFVGIVLVACVAGVFVLMAVSTPPSPEDSLQEARAAYMRHDLATFKSYVDVNSILSDGVDQLVVSPIARSAAQSDSGFGGLLAAGVAATAAAGKQVYLPELSQQVEEFVVTGSVPNQSQDDAFGIAVGSELLRMLAVSQLTYEGIDSTKKFSDSIALVTVRVRSSGSQPQQAQATNAYPSLRIIDSEGHEQPIERVSTAPAESSSMLITLKLRSAGSHWQVVGIQNLPDLAKQLLN